jgi:hypothetical protein
MTQLSQPRQRAPRIFMLPRPLQRQETSLNQQPTGCNAYLLHRYTAETIPSYKPCSLAAHKVLQLCIHRRLNARLPIRCITATVTADLALSLSSETGPY